MLFSMNLDIEISYYTANTQVDNDLHGQASVFLADPIGSAFDKTYKIFFLHRYDFYCVYGGSTDV